MSVNRRKELDNPNTRYDYKNKIPDLKFESEIDFASESEEIYWYDLPF